MVRLWYCAWIPLYQKERRIHKMKKRKDSRNRNLRENEYQRTSGQYEYRWTNSQGKTQSVYSWRLTESDPTPPGKKHDASLRTKEQKIRSSEDRGIDVYTATHTTLNDLFERYLGLKSDVRETTKALYTKYYDRYVRSAIGSRAVGSIKYTHVLGLYMHLINDNNLSVATLIPVNAVLHSMFQIAVRDEIIRSNPVSGVLGECKKTAKEEHNGAEDARKSLTVEEQRCFMDFVLKERRAAPYRLMLTVLFGTGVRVGELFGLTWSDVDFTKGTLKICRSLGYGKRLNEKCDFFVNSPKTKKGRRIIPMTGAVRDALWKEYEIRSITGFCEKVVDGVSGFVFWKDNGNLYRDTDINRVLESLTDACNKWETERAAAEKREPVLVPKFSVHQIRHTVASRLVEVEPNIKTVQAILGHASAAMTLDVYAEAMPDSKAETMKKFEAGLLTG